MDVLVVASRWLENSPLVIHEAFMAGVPVIGTAIGGIVDLLDHGRHGILVPPDDPDALAAALARVDRRAVATRSDRGGPLRTSSQSNRTPKNGAIATRRSSAQPTPRRWTRS